MNHDIKNYLDVAKNTETFMESELDVLKEVLEDFQHNKKTSYHLIEEEVNGDLAGFILFGRTPLTEFTWDIYWVVVNKSLHGKGIGKSLLVRTEEFIRQKMPRAAIKIETSTRKRYSAARGLYKRVDFQEVGKLPNFYAQDDDLIIFYKEVSSA
ncbi:MAG: GNAT family N-acetyltransferase [Candidatus Omnitrophica bacterium]|nr:GNAT family N-acetyltransferase [Candidatus Omnitrophota bacterium]